MTITLEQAVKELTAYNKEHPLDLIHHGLKPAPDEYVRMVLLDGKVYKVCLTRVFMAMTYLWMLSITEPYGPENQDGARIPRQADAVKIAAAFFPKGCTALNEGHSLTVMTCLKFIAADSTTTEGEVHGEERRTESSM